MIASAADRPRTLFEAGAGTTAALMMSWVLCMVLHPEEYKKLQDEIDSVVYSKRLPEFEDLPKLPRVRAVVKETLRWRPVSQTDGYKGRPMPCGCHVGAEDSVVPPYACLPHWLTIAIGNRGRSAAFQHEGRRLRRRIHPSRHEYPPEPVGHSSRSIPVP